MQTRYSEVTRDKATQTYVLKGGETGAGIKNGH